MGRKKAGFADLTWDDLNSWAGSTILSRGRSYQNEVGDLRVTKDGTILAWVQGTDRYATMATMNASGMLSATCSCPYYGVPCKHAVALVLAYLDAVKHRRQVPEASDDDRRLRMLRRGDEDLFSDDDDEEEGGYYDDDGDDDGDDEDSEYDDDPEEPMPVKAYARRTKKGQGTDVVTERLERMSKNQLVEFVLDLIGQYPEIRGRIEEEEALKDGRVSGVVESIRAEIEDLASDPSWQDDWSYRGRVPDYSGVRDRLEAMLVAGHADEVLHLGEDLWRLGKEQVENFDEDGEIGSEITECMSVVMRAVPKSSLSAHDRIMWLIDKYLSDEYGLLEGEADLCRDGNLTRKGWGEAADTLLARLSKLPMPNKKSAWPSVYRRKKIMEWAVTALKASERTPEIIPLLQREAPLTLCYPTLVEHLRAAGRTAEAKAAALEGVRQAADSAPGIAWDIEKQLRAMAEEAKGFPMIAAYRALEFFDRPSVDSYKALERAATKAKLWARVREAAQGFLHTGVRPDLPKATTAKEKPAKELKEWPLPVPEIAAVLPGSRHMSGGHLDTLVRIAIIEKDTPQVLRWYDASKKAKSASGPIHNEVAEAVKTTHPDVSLEIWRNLAEEQIRLVQPAAYETAATYLRKMRGVYEETERAEEWPALMASIRVAHKRKRVLMNILDSLQGKKIVDT
ncbi:MAG: SWIM zinc finger family protein [Thermodesulfobacteriota bacterium]